MLATRPDFQVVGQAFDGLEAIQKAQELQPDLILLDIGLPELNGIEAARQIRILSPKSRIIFVTQESSLDIIGECLRLGAHGYVKKVCAGSELLVAIDTVVQDKQFVSPGFAKSS
jgi:DNA-binding NarL/FixJ family response regulator